MVSLYYLVVIMYFPTIGPIVDWLGIEVARLPRKRKVHDA